MSNTIKEMAQCAHFDMEHPTVFDASEVQVCHWEVPANQHYVSQLYDEGEAFKLPMGSVLLSFWRGNSNCEWAWELPHYTNPRGLPVVVEKVFVAIRENNNPTQVPPSRFYRRYTIAVGGVNAFSILYHAGPISASPCTWSKNALHFPVRATPVLHKYELDLEERLVDLFLGVPVNTQRTLLRAQFARIKQLDAK
jgi:hypothetical protein